MKVLHFKHTLGRLYAISVKYSIDPANKEDQIIIHVAIDVNTDIYFSKEFVFAYAWELFLVCILCLICILCSCVNIYECNNRCDVIDMTLGSQQKS